MIYRTLTRILEPLAESWVRVRTDNPDLARERLGRIAPGRDGVWFHAASMGELAALHPVVEVFLRRCPGTSWWVTTTSVTGRARAAEWFEAPVSLAPLDFPAAVSRCWDLRSPRALVLTETELWPNLIQKAVESKVPVGVINGRISDRTWPRYKRLKGLLGEGFSKITAVAARSQLDAERWVALGVPENRVAASGNTKHDRLTPGSPLKLPWSGVPIVTAASVHPGEIEVILNAWSEVRTRQPQAKLLLAPRHLSRMDPWVQALESRSWSWTAYSASPGPEADVIVLDSMGKLQGALAASSASIQGGTFVPVGGHNLLEAANAGILSAAGPHCENVREEAALLTQHQLLRRVEDSRSLAAALIEILELDRAETRDACRRVLEPLKGASVRAFDWLSRRGVWPARSVHD